MRRRSAPAPVRPCAPKRARRVAKAAAAPEPRFRAHFTQAVRSDEPRLSGNRPAQRLRNLYDEFEKFSGVDPCLDGSLREATQAELEALNASSGFAGFGKLDCLLLRQDLSDAVRNQVLHDVTFGQGLGADRVLAVRACSSLENTVRVFKTGLNPGHGTGWWSYAWPQPLLPDDVEMYGTRSQRQEWRTAGKVVPYPGDAIGPGGPMSRPIYLADAVEATEPYRHVGSGGGVHTFVIVFAIMDASRLRLMGYELGRDCEVIAPGRLLDGTASWPRAGVKPGSDAQYVKDWHGMIAPIDRKHDEQLPGPKQRKQLRKQAFADAAAARRAAADGDEEYDTDPDEDAAVSEDEGDDDAEADTKAAEKRAPLCSDDFASAPPATAAAAGVSDAEAMFHARVAEGCMREVAIYGDYRQKLIPVAIAIVPLEGMSCTNFGGDHETELQKEMRTFYQFGSGNETELQKEKRAAVQFGSGNETARQKEKRAAVLFGSGEETPLQLDAQFGSGKETPLQLEKRAAVLFGSGEETPLQLEKRAAVLFGSGNETQLQLDAHFGSGKETQRQLDGRAAQFTFLPQATETHQWSCGIGAHEAVYFYAKRGALCAGCTLLYRRGMGPNRRCSRAAASAGGRGAEDTVAEGGAGCADGGPGGGGGGV